MQILLLTILSCIISVKSGKAGEYQVVISSETLGTQRGFDCGTKSVETNGTFENGQICYENVECFDDCPPFEEFPLPKSPEYIGTEFIDARDGFDPSRTATFYIIHGLRGDIEASWLQDMKDAILAQGDYNMYIVDWTNGSHPDPDEPFVLYPSSNTRVVGRIVRNHIRDLQTDGLNIADVHCIGISIGAHACGYLGKEFTSPKIGRISGLDPAGLIFECSDGEVCRLDANDADLVDVIHTNAWGTPSTAGITMNCADVDLWPHGGGMQPGCDTDFISSGRCSHFRAVELFQESINQDCTAFYCDSFEAMRNGTCHDSCDSAHCQSWGLQTRNFPLGTFYMETNENSTFCQD